jgi:hypothetical protein
MACVKLDWKLGEAGEAHNEQKGLQEALYDLVKQETSSSLDRWF